MTISIESNSGPRTRGIFLLFFPTLETRLFEPWKVAITALVLTFLVLAALPALARAKDAPITECDVVASDGTDPDRLSDPPRTRPSISEGVLKICSDALTRFPNSPRLKFLLARAEYASGNKDLGLVLLRDAADSGYRHAMFLLGIHVTKIDIRRLLFMDETFTDTVFGPVAPEHQVHPESQEMRNGLSLIEAAAKKNHPMAQFYLGKLYESGTIVPKDSNVAMNWYRVLALQWPGHADLAIAMLYLGQKPIWSSTDDNGVYRKAMIHLERSAKAGNLHAKATLGFMLINPLADRDANVERGLELLVEAGEGHQPLAIATLIEIYAEGIHVEKNLKKARYFACKLARKGELLFFELAREKVDCTAERAKKES